MKTLTYHGEFKGSPAFHVINRNLARELEALDVAIYQNQHVMQNGALTDNYLTFVYEPNFKINPRHKLNFGITLWEFSGPTAYPRGWVRGCNDAYDYTFATSQWVKDLLKSNGVQRVVDIGFGVDTKEFNSSVKPQIPKTNKFRFLFVGGTDPRHGWDTSVRTYFRTFDGSNTELFVKIHTNFPKIDNFMKGFQREDIHYLYEDFPSLAPLYNSCDCLLFPVRGAGIGLPALEAMACGLTVILIPWSTPKEFAGQPGLHTYQLDYTLQKTKHHYKTDCHDLVWAVPDEKQFAQLMELAQVAPLNAAKYVKQFTWHKVAEKVNKYLI
jgi:glycosyltransferase involved in cell wall biosynthesis